MSEKRSVRIRPIIAIVCDDVRIEKNGKPFLIGIYTGGITLTGSAIPENYSEVSNLQVHLWIPFEAEEAGSSDFEVKLIMPNKKDELRYQGKMVIESPPKIGEIIPLTLGPIPLKLWESGNLVILFKHAEDDKYQTIRTIPVDLNITDSTSSEDIGQSS